MMKTVVYQGENFLGDVEIYFENNTNNEVMRMMMMTKGVIRISHFSQASERCPPLAVLHTITSSGICFKMESSSSSSYNTFNQHHQDSPLVALHSTCFRDNKTAVIPLGEQEIHLVAMRSRSMNRKTPFWGFCVGSGLYDSCLSMLDLRCLGIVFDLDETLIVANTMRSFEDRIEALQRKISVETDLQRLAGMMAEVKRYQDDRAILRQYAETDQVVDDGKVYTVEAEVIPALSDNHQTVVRPLIRLQNKNIVLTRINPQIRDTSVLVRLRPAWEDLRNYLTAKGRKRFEVFVCTMAERDYALEMWRLLDPDSNLISGEELLDRIVCVKSGLKKSLFNVFQCGVCHPKMSLVIDDRLKVWDEKDQPRVHVVPAFAPYYAPQAEANNAIPVLCLARNVACNVRGGFYREFDEALLQRIPEVSYEDDIGDIPSPPDVSNYLAPEDNGSGSNANKEPPCFDGMADVEVERRLKEAVLAAAPALSRPSATSSATANVDSRMAPSLPFTVTSPPITVQLPAPQASIPPYLAKPLSQAATLARPLGNICLQDLSLHNSPAREEGEVPESELDPDTRRRLLILQHGQDTRDNIPNEPPFPVRPPVQAQVAGPGPLPVPGPAPVPVPGPVPRVQPRESWFPIEQHMSSGHLSRGVTKELPIEPEPVNIERQHLPPPFLPKMENSVQSGRTVFERKRPLRETPRRDDRFRSSHALPVNHSFQGNDVKLGRSTTSYKNFEVEPERGVSFSESPAGVLRDIARRCGTKVEFRAALVADTKLKFSMEAFFAGEKVGEGTGSTRKEALEQAAQAALMNLADKYLAHKKLDSVTPRSMSSRGQSPSGCEFLDDTDSRGDHASVEVEMVSSSDPVMSDDFDANCSRNSMGSVLALKEFCMREGLGIEFRAVHPASTNPVQKDEIWVEVEIDGKTLGKGAGLTWDEAKMQAAEKALLCLRSMVGQFTQKHEGCPRSLQAISTKRLRSEYSQGSQYMHSRR